MAHSVVFGKGINDYDGIISRIRPEYDHWKNMISRCYSGFHASYAFCEVCPDWLLFSNFLEWITDKPWRVNTLDKDVIIIGNKLYSPETCVYVHKDINLFFKPNGSPSTGLPLGVYRSNNGLRYVSHGKGANGKQVNLGTVDDIMEAHRRWQANKIQRLNELMTLADDERVRARITFEINRISKDLADGEESEWY